MKLIDLNPSFVSSGGEGITDAKWNPVPERKGIGLAFDCPCGDGCRAYVAFENPMDGGPPVGNGLNRWHRTGETFETLSLTPSIARQGECQWHGYLTNGEFKSV